MLLLKIVFSAIWPNSTLFSYQNQVKLLSLTVLILFLLCSYLNPEFSLLYPYALNLIKSCLFRINYFGLF